MQPGSISAEPGTVTSIDIAKTPLENGYLKQGSQHRVHAFPLLQRSETIVQPGSLDAEAGIFAMSFDASGSRLVTCEADKTIKMYREDETATPESHPIDFRPPKDIKRF